MGREPVKRWTVGLLTLVILCFVVACSSQESGDISMPETYFSEAITETESVDGTGGIASSVKDISAVLPDSQIESNVLGVYRDDIPQSQETIQNWLKEIGY